MMSTNPFDHVGPHLSASDLAAMEKQLNCRLPADYKAFLLKTNGGHPQKACFPVLGHKEDFWVDYLLSIDGNLATPDQYAQYSTLAFALHRYAKMVPPDSVIIGVVCRDDLLLLHHSGQRKGQVSLRRMDRIPPDRLTKDPEIGIIPIAPSFSRFLRMLRTDPTWAEQVRIAKQNLMLFHIFGSGDPADYTPILESPDLINRPDDATGFSPLAVAAQQRNKLAVKLLLKHGADPNAESKVPPLICAAQFGLDDIVNLLLQHGADPDVVQSGERTALMAAAECGSLPTTQALLKAGASVNKHDKEGSSAIIYAALRKHWGIADVLQRHAEATDLKVVARIKSWSSHGVPQEKIEQLHKAAAAGKLPEVQTLVAGGIPVDVTDRHGNTALFWAVGDNRVRVAQYLLEHGANPNLAGAGGDTPLLYALDGDFRLPVFKVLYETLGEEQKQSIRPAIEDRRRLWPEWRQWKPDGRPTAARAKAPPKPKGKSKPKGS